MINVRYGLTCAAVNKGLNTAGGKMNLFTLKWICSGAWHSGRILAETGKTLDLEIPKI